MKIFLVALGSKGDNEPFRALALEASSAGHDVYFSHTVDISRDDSARYQELDLPGSMEQVIADQGVSIWTALRTYKSVMEPLLEGVWTASTQQIREIKPDVVVYHPKVMTAAVAAHSVGAIAAEVEIVPTVTPTAEFPPAGFPPTIPRSLWRASYSLVKAGASSLKSRADALATELGVIGRDSDLVLCPVSPTLIPQPEDWPDYASITGQWHVPSRESLDDELENFLTEGPILYAGFGSMRDSRGLARADAIVKAARSLGMKSLLTTGWGGLVASPDHMVASDVLVRTSLPHSLVLPRVDVGVHHGGAGTVHAMVRAGLPSVIMPFLADQPWWASRLHAQGLGPKALPRTTTSPGQIAGSLNAALPARDRVREAGSLIAAEDGLARALCILEDAEAGIGSLRSP
jgi:sterol 3beta-glucosyltransferase